MTPRPTPSKPARLARRGAWLGGVLALAAILAVMIAARGRLVGASPDRLRDEARRSLGAGRFGEALDALDRLARAASPTDRDRVMRAEVLRGLGRIDPAIAELAAIPDGSPLAARARLLTGQMELRRGRMRFAERHLVDALRLDPDLIQARRELVYVYGMQTRRRELAAQLEALSALVPLTFDQAFLWCLTRGSVWDAVEQSETLRGFLDADPADRWSRLALADSLANLGKLDEAEAALEPLAADDTGALSARVRLAMDRGDIDAARRLLDSTTAETPELARLRGRLALLRRDAPAAVRHYRAADEAEPYDRATVYGLAQALRLSGDEAEAARYAEQAQALDRLATLVQYAAAPEGRKDPDLPVKLGEACEDVGRFPEARAWYQIAIDRNPTDPGAQKALFRVESRSPDS